MRELVVATNNKGKLVEIEHFFKDLPFKVISLKEAFPEGIEIEEPGSTYESNAVIKAMTVGKRCGKLTMAEDSGLEIDALNGGPGVYTARYAPGTAAEQNAKFLEDLKQVPDEKRGAKFVSVLALYDPTNNDRVMFCRGESIGKIVQEPTGANGFGQDPIFYYNDGGKTGGEMTKEEKDIVSHRGRSLAKAKELLLKDFV